MEKRQDICYNEQTKYEKNGRTDMMRCEET
jgi:hypothetical protein